MCPKFCSGLTDSNSRGGIAPAQIVCLMGEGTGAAEPGWPGQWESQLCSEGGSRKPEPACRVITPLLPISSQPSSQKEAEIALASQELRQLSQTVHSRLR